MDLGARSSHELRNLIRLLEPNQPGLATQIAATAVETRPAFSIATTACHPSTPQIRPDLLAGMVTEVATHRRTSAGESKKKKCYLKLIDLITVIQ